MFRITEDPSSWSLVQYLAKNYKNDSVVSADMDKVGDMVCSSLYLKALSGSAFRYSELHTRTTAQNMLP